MPSRNSRSGGSTNGLTRAMPAISGWCSASQQVRVPPIDRPATATRSQRAASAWIGGLGRRRPVLPPGRDHVLDGGAVAGEQRQVDGEAGRGQRLGQRPHGLGVAGEAVEDEDAVRTAGGGPRLGTGDDGSGHGRDATGRRPGRRTTRRHSVTARLGGRRTPVAGSSGCGAPGRVTATEPRRQGAATPWPRISS